MTVVTKSPLIGNDTNKIIPISLVEENQPPGTQPITSTPANQNAEDAGGSGQQAVTPPSVAGDFDSSTTEASSCNQSTDTSIDNTATPTHEVDFSGGESSGLGSDEYEPNFPRAELSRLDEMINRPRWVVPVLHNGELEVLLDASIELCRRGVDTRSEACQRFFREGLTISFNKILTDEAVSGWKLEIQKCILKNSEKLIEVCVLKLDQDWFPLLDLLAILFNPNSRFHLFNANRPAERVSLQPVNLVSGEEVFAKPLLDQRSQRGWLVDLINLFGYLGGFKILLDRFNKNLSIPVIAALIRPFGLCAEVLTMHTLQKYFIPIIAAVMQYLENLTDEELKKESKAEAKNDTLSNIINSIKCLVVRLPSQEEKVRTLEMFRLQVILRLLQISSFNGKMNALNEINKLITSTSYSINKHGPIDFDDWLTPEKIAEWIENNNVLSIVLRDSLHQPQYVEKLEKIVRFMIKEKALNTQDLDMIWEAQTGKHEAIVKNVHDLLAKLAWDFTPHQLDHLFECFQGSWVHASKKQREKLLELIRRLAEDDKEGIMAHKVLGLLWNLAQSEDVSTDIMDQALAAHIKILDYSCSQVSSQDRDSQKMTWVSKFVEELKKDRMVLPALKQIREICQLFTEAPHNYVHSQRPMQMNYRNKVINNLHTQFTIVMLVSDSLDSYMERARAYDKEHPNEDPNTIFPDGRFNHNQQVNERLRFLRFLLKDGHLWLCKPQANQIWKTLAENAVYPSDRENCFKWYSKLMGDEPDLDPEITNEFFQQYILKFDPALLTESGMICFERFFRHVNCKESKFSQKRRGGYVLEDLNLIGVEYLWRVVSFSPDEVAEKGIILLKDIYTNLGVRLQVRQVEIHEDFMQDCMNRLQAMYDTVCALQKNTQGQEFEGQEGTNRSQVSCLADPQLGQDNTLTQIHMEANRMIRILTVLKVYIAECDEAYSEERAILPLHRASRGKQVSLLIRLLQQGRQSEDIELWSHTNETIGVVRRQFVNRTKMSNIKAELYLNGDMIDTCNDRKLISQLGIHDKMQLTAKLTQTGLHNPSSPDSSSGSSTGSLHNVYEGPNAEAENCLPGVLLANKLMYTNFLFNLADLGCQLDMPMLRECARDILKLMPADFQAVEKLRKVCLDHVNHYPSEKPTSIAPNLEAMFFGPTPSQVLYNLDVVHSMLVPAYNSASEETWEFQHNFILSGGIPLCLKIISSENFLPDVDQCTKRSTYLTCLKVTKLLLPAIGHGYVQMVAEVMQNDASPIVVTTSMHAHAVLLQKALGNIPSPTESVMRNVTIKLGQFLSFRITGVLPDHTTIRALQKIAWSASGEPSFTKSPLGSPSDARLPDNPVPTGMDGDHELMEQDQDDVSLSKEALEVLTICLVLCPDSIELVCKEKAWQSFIVNLLLVCKNGAIRTCASEQFFLMATCCSGGYKLLLYFITLLFTLLSDSPKDPSTQSPEYFSLLCRLLGYACNNHIPLKQVDILLNQEIIWLKKIRNMALKSGMVGIGESLLEGHLSIIRELILFQSSQKKHFIGSDPNGHNLIRELVEDFLFTASKVMMQFEKSQGDAQLLDRTTPICTTPRTMQAAFELLISLITACLPNLKSLSEMLTSMFYSGNEMPLTEWEYIPPIGPKPHNGFVGLKNAGATCYMNSVIQQLFMIEPIRDYILSAEGAIDEQVDADEMDDKSEYEQPIEGPTLEETGNTCSMMTMSRESEGTPKLIVKADERKEYNLKVLKYVQYIFAHLACSKMQYYVPRGFWKHFRLQGEPVNLREQHDALEFFNSLVDSLDEALKALSYTPILTKVLGGSFADQKICRDCPHRYSREEPFTVLNIDIRNQQNLLESLEQYVKGDLLEGANAYHCEKCNKKVDTVKRLCIKKLPPTLAIQLKRFDYDWERECAIKFNDYFEFPRQLDMMPYTVQGLAMAEGEWILDENEEKKDEHSESECTKYNLVGVVVHSGQASGGHYFSYILHRSKDQLPLWYKFDDGEVTEFKMDDDEEMKNHCFGGEYMGEVFDHMLKRMQYRRQKRWWNAYILFYEKANQREDTSVIDKINKHFQDFNLSEVSKIVKMPAPIEQCVRRQNIRFLHNRNQFTLEYFRFMKRILVCNIPYIQPSDDYLTPESEELAMCSVQLVSKFLFNIGFHTKKSLRGPANDWHEVLVMYFRHSRSVRNWFIQNILFNRPSRFSEFLLESPNTEIRNVFMRLLVFLAHFSHLDGPCPSSMTPVFPLSEANMTVSDHILLVILSLLKKEVPEHNRHLPQYFHFFISYSNLGPAEKLQLLNLNVPHMFMVIALEDSSLPPAKYQCSELTKLFSVVSQLIRCCDVSEHCYSSNCGKPILPNPHREPSLKQPLMKIQTAVAEILYVGVPFVKKMLQDCNSIDETTKLLKFCSWENPKFSSTILNELLLQVAYSYTYELRPYLDLLQQMLIIEDSWQNHRIHNTFKGITEERDGLFDTIHVSKGQHQKRAYQCIKMLVHLLSKCRSAEELLMKNADLKRKWISAVEWLQDELERRPYSSSAQYPYSWSNTQAQSNETSNGYFLERSNSARMTLAKALEFCPEESEDVMLVVDDVEVTNINGDGSSPGDPVVGDVGKSLLPAASKQQPQQIQQLKQQLQQMVPAEKETTSTTSPTTATTTSAFDDIPSTFSPDQQQHHQLQSNSL